MIVQTLRSCSFSVLTNETVTPGPTTQNVTSNYVSYRISFAREGYLSVSQFPG